MLASAGLWLWPVSAEVCEMSGHRFFLAFSRKKRSFLMTRSSIQKDQTGDLRKPDSNKSSRFLAYCCMPPEPSSARKDPLP